MFEKLPPGWVKTTLIEICLPVTKTQPSELPNVEFTYLDIGSIDNYSNRITETKTVTGRDAPSRARQVVQQNDILFSTVRTYLKNIAFIGKYYPNPIASTGFTIIRAAKGIIPRFLFFQVLTDEFLKPVNELQSGTSYPAVRSHDIFSQPILIPPTAEQERIVEKLNSAFLSLERAEIAANRALERLQRYRSAVLFAGLTGQLTNEWRNKNKVVETGDDLRQRLLSDRRFRWEESELNRLNSIGEVPKDDKWKMKYKEPFQSTGLNNVVLPRDWVWASADQCTGRITDGEHITPHRSESGILLLSARNILNGRLSLEHVDHIPETEYERISKRLIIEQGDVLLSCSGSVGRSCVAPPGLKFAAVRSVAVLKPLLEMGNYLSLALRSSSLQEQISEKKTQTVQANIFQGKIKTLVFPLPPLAEQQEIVREIERRLEASNQLSVKINLQLERTQIARRSLLNEAYTGKLVPQNPNDEQASILIERIRNRKAQIKETQHRSSKKPLLAKKMGSDSMQKRKLPESLGSTWENIGREPNARRLFDEAGFGPDQAVQFYEALRATPEVLAAFRAAKQGKQQSPKPAEFSGIIENVRRGNFRLVELWLEDFKNLKNYSIRFNHLYSMDVILGWNGTGKSNLFEALVIIFRDLNEWCEKNRWPDKPMNGYRLIYEIDEHTIEVTWKPGLMKRPELKRGIIAQDEKNTIQLQTIRRELLPLPRFIFGYYSGPTNRLAEHFLPMKQAHYIRLREAKSDDAKTLAKLLEQRRFFCAETHHAKYVLLAFSYKSDPQISKFLKDRLRILDFESALFIIRKPRWARPGTKAEDFWGATGIMRRVMERLRRYAIAPMILDETVTDGYRSTTEQHYYFFLPDLESLHMFAAEYEDARTFFLALESTDFSELIHDVKIQVRIQANNEEQIPITFHQLSEGEQQLLMVLGLMRFTKSHQSLVLLDEPDTHLNPHWSVDFLKDLIRVMSDTTLESPEQQSSQILMATHDPLVIASLLKEQVHLLKRDPQTGVCKWSQATINPRGLGFTGILTSEMFGFRSDLDQETLADLDDRVRLIGKEGQLTNPEKKQLESIDKRLTEAGFSSAFSDPYYAAFVRAWGKRYSDLMAGEQFLTPEKKAEVDRVAREILGEVAAEVEKEGSG